MHDINGYHSYSMETFVINFDGYEVSMTIPLTKNSEKMVKKWLHSCIENMNPIALDFTNPIVIKRVRYKNEIRALEG